MEYKNPLQSKENSEGILVALFRAIRPGQAPKNLFVYAALVFVGKLFDPPLFLRVTFAFLLFTAVSGSVYLLNDILDVEQDRLHPKKRYRPIASGSLPVPAAIIALGILSVGGVVGGYLLTPDFGLVLAMYLVIQFLYCFRLKHVVLMDVFTIAIGFVLRTISGAFVIHVGISQWLLLCSLQLALFLGFGKRRQELVTQGQNATSTRAILSEYSVPFLDQIINVVAGVTIVFYSVYTIESPTAHQHPHLWITVPIVIFSIFRYLYLVHQRGWGGAPDEVLRKDRGLQLTIALWVITILTLFKFDVVGHPLFGIGIGI